MDNWSVLCKGFILLLDCESITIIAGPGGGGVVFRGRNKPSTYALTSNVLLKEIIERLKKLHVKVKQQTSDSSREFLKIENEQIKTVQNNSYG